MLAAIAAALVAGSAMASEPIADRTCVMFDTGMVCASVFEADRPHLKEALARMVDRIELDPATLACVIHYRIGAIGRDKVASPRVADLNPTLRLAMPMALG